MSGAMRNLWLVPVASASLLFGCSHVDNTKNRMDTGGTMSAVDYPAEPYGYQVDNTIQNIEFLGKVPKSASDDYASLPMQKVSLSDFYKSSTAKLLFIVGAARWCGPCNMEAPSIKRLGDTYAPQVQLL